MSQAQEVSHHQLFLFRLGCDVDHGMVETPNHTEMGVTVRLHRRSTFLCPPVARRRSSSLRIPVVGGLRQSEGTLRENLRQPGGVARSRTSGRRCEAGSAAAEIVGFADH